MAGIQSVYNKAYDLGRFDLVIVDECHLIAPDGEGMYRTFLKDMKVINPNVRLIGLTATPFRLKGGAICKPGNLLNEVCYEAGLKEMIAQGYLSPLVSRAGHAEADLSSVHTRAGEFVQDELASAMDNEQLVGLLFRNRHTDEGEEVRPHLLHLRGALQTRGRGHHETFRQGVRRGHWRDVRRTTR